MTNPLHDDSIDDPKELVPGFKIICVSRHRGIFLRATVLEAPYEDVFEQDDRPSLSTYVRLEDSEGCIAEYCLADMGIITYPGGWYHSHVFAISVEQEHLVPLHLRASRI